MKKLVAASAGLVATVACASASPPRDRSIARAAPAAHSASNSGASLAKSDRATTDDADSARSHSKSEFSDFDEAADRLSRAEARLRSEDEQLAAEERVRSWAEEKKCSDQGGPDSWCEQECAAHGGFSWKDGSGVCQ